MGDQKQVGEAAKNRLADAEAWLRKFQAAIAAGVDPTALVEVINAAQAERVTAQAEINNTPASRNLGRRSCALASHGFVRSWPGQMAGF